MTVPRYSLSTIELSVTPEAHAILEAINLRREKLGTPPIDEADIPVFLRLGALRACERCGIYFHRKSYHGQAYCSNACRQAAYRARKATR